METEWMEADMTETRKNCRGIQRTRSIHADVAIDVGKEWGVGGGGGGGAGGPQAPPPSANFRRSSFPSFECLGSRFPAQSKPLMAFLLTLCHFTFFSPERN